MSEKGYSRGYRKDRERKRSMDTKKKESTETARLSFLIEVNCGGSVLHVKFLNPIPPGPLLILVHDLISAIFFVLFQG